MLLFSTYGLLLSGGRLFDAQLPRFVDVLATITAEQSRQGQIWELPEVGYGAFLVDGDRDVRHLITDAAVASLVLAPMCGEPITCGSSNSLRVRQPSPLKTSSVAPATLPARMAS